MKRKNKNTKKRSKYRFIGGYKLKCNCINNSKTSSTKKSSKPSPCKQFKIQFPSGSSSFQKVEDLISQGISAKEACEKVKKANQEKQKKQDEKSTQKKQTTKQSKKKGGYKSKKRSPTKKKKSRKPMLVIF